MNYFLSLTDLHTLLAVGMRDNNDEVIYFAARSSRARKIAQVPYLFRALVRVALDKRSHVYASHPFSTVAAAFIAVSRRFSLFDDGVAYYAPSALPSRRRERVIHLITRRKFNWRLLKRLDRPTFIDLLRHSSAVSFRAIFPDLIDVDAMPIIGVNLDRTFRPVSMSRETPVSLFLDTRDESLPLVDTRTVVLTLHRAAQESPTGTIFFKPHPTEASRISRELREQPWAIEVRGAFEGLLQHMPIAKLYSFHSSGAISTKLMQRDTELYCLRLRNQELPEGLVRLFRSLAAIDLILDSPGSQSIHPASSE